MKGVKYTTQSFTEKLKDIGSEFNVVGEYTGALSKIKVKCPKCEKVVEMHPTVLMRGAKCCNLCRSLNKRLTEQQFKNKIADNIELLEPYVSSDCKIRVRCKIDGNEWNPLAKDLLSGRSCPECKKRKLANLYKKSHEQFVSDVENINSSIKIISKYTGANSFVKCQCTKCEYIWKTKAANIIYNNSGCPRCNSSKGERKIELFLLDKNIKYIPQKRFENCVSIDKNRELPFDFFLPNLNTLIEYQGIQHYKPVEYFGGDNRYEVQKQHDEVKRLYAINNGYTFIEIKYVDYNNIEEILSKKLK